MMMNNNNDNLYVMYYYYLLLHTYSYIFINFFFITVKKI